MKSPTPNSCLIEEPLLIGYLAGAENRAAIASHLLADSAFMGQMSNVTKMFIEAIAFGNRPKARTALESLHILGDSPGTSIQGAIIQSIIQSVQKRACALQQTKCIFGLQINVDADTQDELERELQRIKQGILRELRYPHEPSQVEAKQNAGVPPH